MPAIRRAQLVIQTWEGELVTSVLLTFEKVTNEYITLASLQWLMDFDDDQMTEFLERTELITKHRHGMEWVNCSDVIPAFGWTPS